MDDWGKMSMKIINKGSKYIILFVLASSFELSAESNNNLNVCISVVKERKGDKGVVVDMNNMEKKKFDYKVKIDNGNIVDTSPSKAINYRVPNNQKIHTVIIYRGNKQEKSFKFDIGAYNFLDLCLRFNNFYETWHLIEANSAPRDCSCFDEEFKAGTL